MGGRRGVVNGGGGGGVLVVAGAHVPQFHLYPLPFPFGTCPTFEYVKFV